MPFTLDDDRLECLRAAPLVDADRVFALIKRSFSGKAAHVLGELFQNAQRPGARQVAISFPDGYDAPRLSVLPKGSGGSHMPSQTARFPSPTQRRSSGAERGGPPRKR